MKKRVIIIIVILIVSNLWLSFSLILLRKQTTEKLAIIENTSGDDCVEEIAEAYIKSLKYYQIDHHVSDYAADTILSLFNKTHSRLLFYRIDFPYCGNCVLPTIDNLIEKLDEIGSEKIVILTSFPSMEYADELNEYIKDSGLNILNLPHNEFCLDCNNFIGAYLFTMDIYLNTQNLFFTNKCNTSIVSKYLNFVNTNYMMGE